MAQENTAAAARALAIVDLPNSPLPAYPA